MNAFKYQLQHYLFHDAKNATLNESVVQSITLIIIGLQAAARYLQETAKLNEVNYIFSSG